MKLFYLLVLSAFVIFCAGNKALGQQQQPAVKGMVQSETGEALPNLTVTVTNKSGQYSATAQTDSSGAFTFVTLTAGDSYSFSFTHVGYQKKVLGGYTFKGGDMIRLLVKLAVNDNSLDEIVVVGYGSQKKVNLTGAVTQVSGKVLSDRPMPNISRGLQGLIPNLNIVMTDGKPTRSPGYNIRGITSIGTGGEALVLIDGVAGDPNLLNPNDVETVTVLKDAASAAIYGARGSFGVVLITTKNPNKGKVQVNFNSSYTINQKTVNPKLVNDGYEWTKNFGDSYNAWYDYKSLPATINGIIPYTPAYLDSLKARSADPSLPKVTIDPATGRYIYYGSTDWYNELYRKSAPAFDNALTVSGSNTNSDFLISGRYYKQGGVFRYNTDEFNRYNLRMKGNIKLTPWFTLSNNIDFNAYKYFYPIVNGGSPVWRYMDVSAVPMAVMFNPDGTLTPSSYQSVGDMYTGNNNQITKQMYFRNTLSFSADIIKNVLNLKGDFTYAYTNNTMDEKLYPVSYSAGPGIEGANTNNRLTKTTDITNYYATNIYAEAKKDFGNHSIKLLGGMNIEVSQNDSTLVQRDGILDPSLPNINLLNGQNYILSGDGNEWSIAGLFFRGNYSYKNKYLVEVNGRYDGSSKFPSYSRFGFFPSVSAGWLVSREPFMNFSDNWLDNLKLRVSVGSLGNGQIAPYRFISLMNVTQGRSIALNGAYPTYVRNPSVLPDNLTWETSTTVDGGIDIGMLKNRLNVSFDYYQRYTTNMFTPSQPLPSTFGATVPYGNYSDLKTSGWELSVNWHDNINENLGYSLGLVLSDYKAYITKYNNPNGVLPYGGNAGTYYEGQRLGEIWGFETEGLYTQEDLDKPHPNQTSYISVSNSNIPLPGDIKFRDLNGDDSINIGKGTLADHGDLKIIGNSLPRYNFGVNLGMNWKSLSFSAFVQGIGYRDWWPGIEAGPFWGQYNRPYESIPADMMKNVWTPENPDAYFPRYRGYVALSGTRELAVKQTRYLQNAAYLRLKNVNLTWALPQKWVRLLKLTNARVYVTGQNILTFTPMHKYAANFDPEVIDGSDPEVNANAGNGYAYPMLKSYSVGVNLTF
ncbi:SusC/RagA family TonB-linked outer membrane protein [Flavitalea sp.]|nr:TonB-dependent receptor [Flavitalea sp.]